MPRFRKVMRWLRDRAPDDVATCVIHNELRRFWPVVSYLGWRCARVIRVAP